MAGRAEKYSGRTRYRTDTFSSALKQLSANVCRKYIGEEGDRKCDSWPQLGRGQIQASSLDGDVADFLRSF